MNEENYLPEEPEVKSTASPTSYHSLSATPIEDNAPIYFPDLIAPLIRLISLGFVLGILHFSLLSLIAFLLYLQLNNSILCPNEYRNLSDFCTSKEINLMMFLGLYLPMFNGFFYSYLSKRLERRKGVILVMALGIANTVSILIYMNWLLENLNKLFLDIPRDHDHDSIINSIFKISSERLFDHRLVTLLFFHQYCTMLSYITDQLKTKDVTFREDCFCGLLYGSFFAVWLGNLIDVSVLSYLICNYIIKFQT